MEDVGGNPAAAGCGGWWRRSRMKKASAAGVECILFFIKTEFWMLARGREGRAGSLSTHPRLLIFNVGISINSLG